MKKGFTITELLAVIVILAVIITIAVPSAIAIQNKTKKNLYCKKIEMIENAAKLYGQDNYDIIGDETKPVIVTIEDLLETIKDENGIAAGSYLNKDSETKPYIVDPRNDNGLDEGEVAIFVKNKRVYAHYQNIEEDCDGNRTTYPKDDTDNDTDNSNDEQNLLCESNSNILRCKILAQYGGADAIEEAPNEIFSMVTEATTNVIYKMEDEYGMSYYYRGAKGLLKNNVIFAEHQWKIIRINGDGSIRIIYNGTCSGNACAINSAGIATQISNDSGATTSAFNINKNDNRYVGYMYGNSSDTYENTHANINNSSAKIQLDIWYANNIKGSIYESYIVDNIFCNDRSLSRSLTWDENGGTGTASTYYGTVRSSAETIISPTLKCLNPNDQFTIKTSSVGNKALDYPIGLITDEEAWGAGVGLGNKWPSPNNYLDTAQDYWTMTPHYFYGGNAYAGFVGAYGHLDSPSGYVHSAKGLRPVLNLYSNTQVTGDGSATDPFKVVGL